MKKIGELYQSGDWKNEKHVPVIHVNNNVKAGEDIEIEVLIGEEIGHPNELEHHIKWMNIYFHPEGEKFPVEIAHLEFNAHGELGVTTDYYAKAKFKAEKSGIIYATSYCNIHGLWENSAELVVG